MNALFQYIPGNSVVHKLDPRTKIIIAIAFSIVIMQADFIGLIIVAAVISAGSLLGRIPVYMMMKSLRPVMPLFFILFAVYVFFTPGIILFSIGPVKVSCQGLQTGGLQISRFILLVLTASLLTMSTKTTQITMGLESIISPLNRIGLSSHNLAMMLTLALRFIPVLAAEKNSIEEAQLSRNGSNDSWSIRSRIRATGNLALPLAVNLLHRADELVDAMEARGYTPGERTYLYELVLTGWDYLLIFTVVFLTVLYLFI
ncbi:MAG: energy-coupling factor transporter transmembrane component T [Syntrophomonadaceae bacterium]|nr:energy-coupling factor transporter transmembrane component T [Syntrophomonadaceae bacterium]